MLYGSTLTVHAFAMSASIALFVASEFLLMPASRAPVRAALFASRLADILIKLGLLAGLVLVYVGGWPLLTPWLVLSFLLIAAVIGIGRSFVEPWQARAGSALAGSTAELRQFALDRRARIGRIAMIAVFALIAAVMVVKPELL